jgi:DNA repair exonuclease SbcCD ATPase subunit
MREQQLVVISDVHVHPWSAFASGTGANNSRLLQTLNVLGGSLEEARDRDATWICAGDIVHTAGLTKNPVLNLTIDKINEYPDVPKYIIWGNHDSRGKGKAKITADETATKAIVEACENIRLLQPPSGYADENGMIIYGEGAQPGKEHYEFKEDADVGVFHLMVDESKTPTGHILESDIKGRDLLEKYHLVIAGDIHHPNTTWWEPEVENEGRRLLLVPGAPEHHNFGDSGDRGWWVVTMQEIDGVWWPSDAEMVPSDSPKFVTVSSVDDVKDDGNFYRIKGEAVRKEDLPDNAIVVSSPPSTVEQRDIIQEGASTQEVLKAWLEESPPEFDDISLEDYLEVGEDLLSEQDLYQLKEGHLARVEGKNFFSYDEFTFDLQSGTTLVVGESKDFESNGAGKSTLFDSIYWALFGKTTKGVAAADVIRWGMNECSVTLFMEAEGAPMKVTRRRTKTAIEVDAEINGDPVKGGSATAVTNKVLEYLGLTEDIFRALAYYSQEDVLLFSRATDSERKALLSDLCGLGAYDRASTEARKRAADAESDLDRIVARKDTLQERLFGVEDRLESREEDLLEWEDAHEAEIEEAEEELEYIRTQEPSDTLDARLADIQRRGENLVEMWKDRRQEQYQELADKFVREDRKRIEESIENCKKSFILTEDEYEDCVERVEQFDRGSVQDEHTDIGSEYDEKKHQKSKLSKRSTTLEAKQRRAAQDLKQYKEKLDDRVCPECGQKVPVDHIKSKIGEKSNELSDITSELEDVNADKEQVEEELEELEEDISELEDSLEEYDLLVARVEDHEDILEDIENLRAQEERAIERASERAEDRVSSLIEKDERRVRDWVRKAEDHVQFVKDAWQTQVDAAENKLSSLKARENPHMSTVQDLSEQMDELTQELEKVDARRISLRDEQIIYEYWANGLSKQGIQSLLLEEVASEFNKIRTEVFPLLTHGVYDVQFSTTRRTQSGELREKTEFIVRYNGDRIEYENLSGGQRRRVDLGVMVTLALANSRMRGVRGVLGMMVWDEAFDFLDSDGAESVVETLTEITDTIPSIYVISQETSLKSMFPQVLEIVQDEDGISRIVS